MKLLSLPFVLLFSLTISFGQNKLIDTAKLADYSYLIMGRTRSGCTVQATGFLVRSKNKLFLVTACHVINGWNYESFEKDDSYPDTLYLRIYGKSDNRVFFLPLDIRALKHIKADPDSPDVYFYPLVIPDQLQVNTLEALIATSDQTVQPPDEIIVYGFCLTEDSDSIDFKSLTVRKARPWLHDKNDYTCDPYIYHLSYAANDLGPGDSGSPVYFIYKDQSGKILIQFGGLVFGGAPSLHQALVLRPEIIKNLMR